MTRGARLPRGRSTLADLLFAQGFGSRAEVQALVAAGRVALDGGVVRDPGHEVGAEGTVFEVDGQRWTAQASVLVMLHKPTGFECSARPSAWPSVLTLLPAPLRRRGVQPVGRLDQDTTGLLLLTDDGKLLHRLTSPRQHVPKVYEAVTARPLDAAQLEALRGELMLRGEAKPARALAAEVLGERRLRLVIDEGRYHQVRRMIAAVGNHCDRLHRSAIGALALPPDLPEGAWRLATAPERALLAPT